MSTDKAEYEVGETVGLHIEWSNSGDQPLDVPFRVECSGRDELFQASGEFDQDQFSFDLSGSVGYSSAADDRSDGRLDGRVINYSVSCRLFINGNSSHCSAHEMPLVGSNSVTFNIIKRDFVRPRFSCIAWDFAYVRDGETWTGPQQHRFVEEACPGGQGTQNLECYFNEVYRCDDGYLNLAYEETRDCYPEVPGQCQVSPPPTEPTDPVNPPPPAPPAPPAPEPTERFVSVGVQDGRGGYVDFDGHEVSSQVSFRRTVGVAIRIQAIPESNFRFDSWSDSRCAGGEIRMPSEDLVCIARFVQTTSSPIPTEPAAPVIPGVPTHPRVQCSFDGRTVTISWDAMPGATVYYPRIDDLTNNSAFAHDGWWLPNTTDIMREVVENRMTHAIEPGKSYRWWVHSGNSAGYSEPSGGSFVCVAP